MERKRDIILRVKKCIDFGHVGGFESRSACSLLEAGISCHWSAQICEGFCLLFVFIIFNCKNLVRE